MHKALSIDHNIALTSKTSAASDCILFIFTFHLVNNAIKPIVNCNFNMFNSVSSTLNIFYLFFYLQNLLQSMEYSKIVSNRTYVPPLGNASLVSGQSKKVHPF